MNMAGMMNRSRGTHLHRDLHCLALCVHAALQSELVRLRLEHVRERDAVGLSLDDRAHEPAECVHSRPLRRDPRTPPAGPVPPGCPAGCAPVPGRAPRARSAPRAPWQRRTRAGVDGDAHLVERVGQLPLDRCPAVGPHALQPNHGIEEAEDLVFESARFRFSPRFPP